MVTSTYEAEAIALIKASEEVEVLCDNHDVVSSVYSTKDTCKSIRVRADVGRMEQIIDRREVTIVTWIPTEKQLADAFTHSTVSRSAICSKLANAEFSN